MLKEREFPQYEDSPKERELDRLNCEAISQHNELKSLGENFSDPTQEDEFLSFKFLLTNGCTINGKEPLTFFKDENLLTKKMQEFHDEFARCSKCKEWGAVGSVCCGNRPIEAD